MVVKQKKLENPLLIQPTGNSKRNIYILTIALSVLAIYFFALQSGFLAIDDPIIIRSIASGTLRPEGLRIEYFRPLTALWFLLDYRLFGADPAGYHATSILFHLVNALLVYYLATIVFRKINGSEHYSFLAAMLFAVHPVNSESVTWIAARSELLCCFFLLLCLIAVFKALQQATPARLACVFLFFLCSIAAKEASLFLPFLALIYFFLERKNLDVRAAGRICASLFTALFLYFLLRYGLTGTMEHLPAASPHTGGREAGTVISVLAAFGFYIRKLFYPFPLNIAITEINTTLGAASFLMFAAAAVILWIRVPGCRFHLAFLVSALTLPLAAFVLNYSWTPYGERYLYIPSVSFALLIAVILNRYSGSIPRSALIISLLLLAVPTAYRVRMWSDPIRFWRDAAEKSPRFGSVRLVLAAEYLQAGRYPEAEQNLQRASALGLARKNARDLYQDLRKKLDDKVRQSNRRPSGNT